jgi:XTP/dITP diphosphohydrolase
VYSARYAGAAKSDEANMDKVLSNMADIPVEERSARFRCVLAVASPDQPTQTFEGSCEGVILTERRGEHGFGYDPIFYVPSFDRSMAELLPQEKALISHRGNAIKELKASLPGWMKATN